MLLKNKVGVIYGAGGAIGGAVARAFASEGAKVFLSGRKRAPVEAIAKEIVSAGGSAEAAEVDALDEKAVDKHLQFVIDKAGRVDISFNAISIPPEKILGVPLIEMDVEQFSLAIASYTRSYFLTARLAARRMVQNKSGVIMTITALPSRKGTPLNGGYGSAQAAKEALTRDLSAELAPQGIRVVALRPHGMPETTTIREVYEMKATTTGITWEQFQGYLASTTHPQRVMALEEVANMAVFMASDKASGMTGNYRQYDHGQPRRLAAKRSRPRRSERRRRRCTVVRSRASTRPPIWKWVPRRFAKIADEPANEGTAVVDSLHQSM